jgi:hypothetical protein
MHPSLRSTWRSLTAGGLLALAGCGSNGDSIAESEGAAVPEARAAFRYHRDYVFVAPRADPPLVVPFSFRSTDTGTQLVRASRGWLARGTTWDRFLDERAETSRAGGVWRVVPQGDLRVDAGGAAEVEALRFQHGERRLRLQLDAPLTGWHQGGDTRFRLIAGRLSIGAESLGGPVLEVLRVERVLDDGWPPGEDFDALFLTSGDSVQLVLAERIGGGEEDRGFGWMRNPRIERTWDDAEIRWLEMRPYQEARRDIPRRWYFQIPAAGIEGELDAVGFDAVLGPERAGRRAVEIRYSVTGFADLDGNRLPVVGTIRHTQQ